MQALVCKITLLILLEITCFNYGVILIVRECVNLPLCIVIKIAWFF